METTNRCWSDDVGKLLLRITIGGLMLFHGIDKIMHKEASFDPIVEMLKGHNLPGWIAYGVYVGEIVAPFLILVGFFTRIAAFVFAVNMLVAVWLAHTSIALKLNDAGGWALELQALYALGALAIVFLGPGVYSVSGCLGGQTDSVPPPAAVK